MRALFTAIKDRIEDKVPEIKFIAMWNSQTEMFEDFEGNKGSMVDAYQMPCVFVEFQNDLQPQQLGQGVQMYDPLIIKIRLVHQQFDAGDGTQEQNFDVYDLKQKLYKYLNRFEPDGASAFVRNGETQDQSHTNIYNFVQAYVTNYIDNSAQGPVDGVTKEPPTELNITLSVEGSEDPDDPYTIVDEGAVVENYLVAAITGGARITFDNIFDEGIVSFKVYRKTMPSGTYADVHSIDYDGSAASYSYDNTVGAGNYNYKLSCVFADDSEIDLDNQDITVT